MLELFARPEAPRGPETGFDEREWLARQGVHVVVHGSHWRVVGRRGGIGGIADRVREQLAHGIAAGTHGRRQALVLGIVLGADGGLAPEVRDAFRASGLAHLLAVSGQNVAFVVIGTVAVLFVLGFSTLVGHAAAIAAVAAYVAAVGWEPSVIRAGVAGGLVSLAWLAARERDHWHFMAVGALVLLVWHPKAWQEPGFQLSFAAVASIFVLYGRLVSVAEGYPVPRRVAEVGALTVSASLATAPIAYLPLRHAADLDGSGEHRGGACGPVPALVRARRRCARAGPSGCHGGAQLAGRLVRGLDLDVRPCVRVVAVRRGRVSRWRSGWSVLCSWPVLSGAGFADATDVAFSPWA